MAAGEHERPALGRRRAALLRQREEQAQAQQLTAADVAALERDPSPEVRAVIAAKFGRQFEALLASGQRDLALGLVELLARDAAPAVRQALAGTLAGSPNLPPGIARQLGRDEAAVAAPILERSPVLGEADLEPIVRACGAGHALAVAGRVLVPEALADLLAGTGDREVLLRLAGNQGAMLSAVTLEQMLAEHRSEALEARLLRRRELPPAILAQLIAMIGDRLDWDAVRQRRMAPEEALSLLAATRGRAGLLGREHDEHQLLRQLSARFAAGQLPPEALLLALRHGDLDTLEVGLALHARIPPGRARRLLASPDRRQLAALCAAAGLATPHYAVLRMVLDLAEGAVVGAERDYGLGTLRYVQVEYERLKDDAGRLRELLGA